MNDSTGCMWKRGARACDLVGDGSGPSADASKVGEPRVRKRRVEMEHTCGRSAGARTDTGLPCMGISMTRAWTTVRCLGARPTWDQRRRYDRCSTIHWPGIKRRARVRS